jgi:hypothetical protein
LPRCSTAQPLYTRFPIVFSRCFPKVTIGYHPTCVSKGTSCEVSSWPARGRWTGGVSETPRSILHQLVPRKV